MGHAEPGSAGPVGTRPGGDFLPRLLSSEFQRSHRTPAQLSGGCCPGWVTWGGVSPGAVPQGQALATLGGCFPAVTKAMEQRRNPHHGLGGSLEGGPGDVDSPPTGINWQVRTREQQAQSEVGRSEVQSGSCGLCVPDTPLQGHGLDGYIHQRLLGQNYPNTQRLKTTAAYFVSRACAWAGGWLI